MCSIFMECTDKTLRDSCLQRRKETKGVTAEQKDFLPDSKIALPPSVFRVLLFSKKRERETRKPSGSQQREKKNRTRSSESSEKERHKENDRKTAQYSLVDLDEILLSFSFCFILVLLSS